MKLNKPYDNQKTRDFLAHKFNKPFDEISEEEFITTCCAWNAMMIEMADTNIDTNFKTMEVQVAMKSVYWEK